MKIALLGAPGSGKTKIARRLARRLNAESKSWTVIDGYVDRLSDRTGIPFGADQSIWAFRYHIQVVGERWTLESEASHKDLSSITCGTLYESIIYAAAQSMVIPQLEDEEWILSETQLAQVMMQAFGILAPRTHDYLALFYLPLESSERNWNAVIDAKIPEVLEGQGKTAIPLLGTDKQKVDRAEEVIRKLSSLTENDQSTV